MTSAHGRTWPGAGHDGAEEPPTPTLSSCPPTIVPKIIVQSVETAVELGLGVAIFDSLRYHVANNPAFPGVDRQWHGSEGASEWIRVGAWVRRFISRRIEGVLSTNSQFDLSWQINSRGNERTAGCHCPAQPRLS